LAVGTTLCFLGRALLERAGNALGPFPFPSFRLTYPWLPVFPSVRSLFACFPSPPPFSPLGRSNTFFPPQSLQPLSDLVRVFSRLFRSSYLDGPPDVVFFSSGQLTSFPCTYPFSSLGLIDLLPEPIGRGPLFFFLVSRSPSESHTPFFLFSPPPPPPPPPPPHPVTFPNCSPVFLPFPNRSTPPFRFPLGPNHF